MRQQNLVTLAIDMAGLSTIAAVCSVSYQAVRKWERLGRLPKTEFTNETDHARAIARATKGRISRKRLRDWSMKRIRRR